jgi:hyperosmotically inducible periplasmic protein
MRKSISIAAITVAAGLMLFISACSNNANKSSSNRPQTNMSNSDLESIVKDKLNSDPQLSAANIKVDADSKKNEIKLSGDVNSEDMRRKAVDSVRSVLPKFNVADTIDVKPQEMARANYDQQSDQERQIAKSRGDSIGNSAEDARIHSQIMHKLSDAKAKFQNVKIDVDEGVVTLRGNVESGAEKAKIQQSVQQVEGVKRIDNKLEVGG